VDVLVGVDADDHLASEMVGRDLCHRGRTTLSWMGYRWRGLAAGVDSTVMRASCPGFYQVRHLQLARA
jgi:hypothetical protein